MKEDAIPASMKEVPYNFSIKKHKVAQRAYEQSKNPKEKLETLKILKQANHELENARRKSIDISSMNDLNTNKLEDILFREYDALSQMEITLAQFTQNEELKKKYNTTVTPLDLFDSTARSNLAWLTIDTELFHRMGPKANEALYRMIDEINKNRTTGNQISLESRILSSEEQNILRETFRKVRGSNNLRSADGIARMEKDIGLMLSYSEKYPSHPMSLESHINGLYEQTYK